MFKLIYHFFVPHKGNNHRSKIIHNSSLFALILLILFTSWFSILINKTHPEILGISYSISDQELLRLVNEERIKNGSSPLRMNNKLINAANNKANHMFSNNYWAHFAPDNTTPWEFITKSNYDYVYAGENLAKGFVNARDVVEAWMNSPAHKDNILSRQYEDIGFAIVEGNLQGEDTVLVVEIFGKEKNQFLAKVEDENFLIASSNSAVGLEQAIDINQTAEVPLLGESNISNTVKGGAIQETLISSKPSIDIFISSKTFSFLILSVLLIALILDYTIILKKRIPRIVGNNIDHIILISIFIVFIFVHNIGVIL